MKKTKYKTEVVLQTTCGATTTVKSVNGHEGIFSNYNPETNICNINIDNDGQYMVVNWSNVCFATVRPLGENE